jgi:hypothetical protein
VVSAAGVLLLAGAAAYGWYVANGGLYGDDWGNIDTYRFGDAPRFLSDVHLQAVSLGGRPLLALFLPVPPALFGLHSSLYIAFGVLLVVATSLSFYVLLRVLDLGRIEAAAISVLALLFPWADAIELWPTASINTIAVLFFFVGLVVALLGLKRRGRSAVVWHGVAALFYLCSVLTYEVAGCAAVLAGFLYLGRAPHAEVFRRWVVDVVVVIASLTYSLIRTGPVRHVGSLHERIADLRGMSRDALALFGSSVVPIGSHERRIRELVIVLAALLVGVLLVRARRGMGDRVWLYFGAGCVVAIVAAYFMFLGSGLRPLQPATGTRTNVFARFAYAGLVYALVAAATQIAVRKRSTARLITLAVVALIVLGYCVRLARDESGWVRAGRLQNTELAAINAGFPHLSSGSTVATFDFPAEVSPGAPVFVATWDLTGAVRLEHRDPKLQAFPIYQSVTVRCGPRDVVIQLPGSRGTAIASYRKLFFLDATTRRRARISSPSRCARALTQFKPGPYFAP